MSQAYNKVVNAVSSNDPVLIAAEINHPALPEPIRIVNDNADIVIDGETFIACGFRCVLPKDRESGVAMGTLEIDNAGKEIMPWLEQSRGGVGAKFTLYQVLRSNPDQIEFQVTLDLAGISADNMTVSAELGFKNLLTKPANPLQYRPNTAPALF